MAGIVFPNNWLELISTGTRKSFPFLGDLNDIKTSLDLENELTNVLIDVSERFHGQRIGLALSGGLDSSVLAVLLKQLDIDFVPLTIAGDSNHPDLIFAQRLVQQFRLKNWQSIILPASESCREKYDLLFEQFVKLGIIQTINGDAVDELLGGYFAHQKPNNFQELGFDENQSLSQEIKRWQVFVYYWQRLYQDHLKLMVYFSIKYGIKVALPYLAIINFLKKLPIKQRVTNYERKIILRELATKLKIPDVIIQRKKIGLCGVFN